MAKTDKQTDLISVENGEVNELALIMRAIDKLGGEGAESAVAIIEKLVVLKRDQERWDAKKEFYRELSEFQNACPPIKKDSTAEVVTKSGGKYSYKYAKIDKIERTVKPLLIHRGFSYSWDSETNGNKEIKVTCHLRHKAGHEITASATAPIPATLAAMNDIQIPSTVRSYLQRGTLIQVLGLTTADENTDAASPVNPITDEQIENINKAIGESVPPDAVPRFLKYLKVGRVEEISQTNYEYALQLLARKKKEYESGK